MGLRIELILLAALLALVLFLKSFEPHSILGSKGISFHELEFEGLHLSRVDGSEKSDSAFAGSGYRAAQHFHFNNFSYSGKSIEMIRANSFDLSPKGYLLQGDVIAINGTIRLETQWLKSDKKKQHVALKNGFVYSDTNLTFAGKSAQYERMKSQIYAKKIKASYVTQ